MLHVTDYMIRDKIKAKPNNLDAEKKMFESLYWSNCVVGWFGFEEDAAVSQIVEKYTSPLARIMEIDTCPRL